MSIKCPICGEEHEEGTIKFCTVCMYSIGSDAYLTNLLNHPSLEDLRYYNQSLEEFRALWNEKKEEQQKIVDAQVRIEQEKKILKLETRINFTDLGYTTRIDMVLVEGGTFMMGSNEGQSNEKPVHEVTVGSFMMGKYKITQELWESVMGSNPSSLNGKRRPVEKVSWYDVVEFCNKLSEKEGLIPVYTIDKNKKDPTNKSKNDKVKWMVSCDFNSNGYRLPTEAEWEYTARGGNKSKGYKYSGTDNIFKVAWGSVIHEVGFKSPNELGIYDMSGNVWEWCWDWYGDYSSESQTNPQGPNAGSTRVIRGGSRDDYAEKWRVSCRYDFHPDTRFNDSGFRLARTKK